MMFILPGFMVILTLLVFAFRVFWISFKRSADMQGEEVVMFIGVLVFCVGFLLGTTYAYFWSSHV